MSASAWAALGALVIVAPHMSESFANALARILMVVAVATDLIGAWLKS